MTSLSIFSWILIGAKSQKTNIQLVRIPEDAKEAIVMISAMTLHFLKLEKEEKHFLLDKFENELLPGLNDNHKELKRLFELRGNEFGFHLPKLIHNMVLNCIGKATANHQILDNSLRFKTEFLQKLEYHTFPYIKKQTKNNGTTESKNKNKKKKIGSNTGSGKVLLNLQGTHMSFSRSRVKKMDALTIPDTQL